MLWSGTDLSWLDLIMVLKDQYCKTRVNLHTINILLILKTKINEKEAGVGPLKHIVDN